MPSELGDRVQLKTLFIDHHYLYRELPVTWEA